MYRPWPIDTIWSKYFFSSSSSFTYIALIHFLNSILFSMLFCFTWTVKSSFFFWFAQTPYFFPKENTINRDWMKRKHGIPVARPSFSEEFSNFFFNFFKFFFWFSSYLFTISYIAIFWEKIFYIIIIDMIYIFFFVLLHSKTKLYHKK